MGFAAKAIQQSADVISAGRSFQICGPTTGNAGRTKSSTVFSSCTSHGVNDTDIILTAV